MSIGGKPQGSPGSLRPNIERNHVAESEEIIPFADDSFAPAVRGFLHRPAEPSGDAIVLSHGAGSNCAAPLLSSIASSFSRRGFLVLRCDLPFRQARRYGPPLGTGGEDRKGLRHALQAVRRLAQGRIFLGGHSYGGRQATILAAEEGVNADGLLLFSYPLHPPRRPEQLRTAHFPRLQTRSLFLQGSRDPFASPEEMRLAIKLIPAETELVIVEGVGHDLVRGRAAQAGFGELIQTVERVFQAFFSAGRRLGT
jgi:uncharacterized protein